MKTIIVLGSTRAVIKAERLLREQFYCKVIPVPRNISSECGMALEVKPEDNEQIVLKLEDACLFEHSFYNLEN